MSGNARTCRQSDRSPASPDEQHEPGDDSPRSRPPARRLSADSSPLYRNQRPVDSRSIGSARQVKGLSAGPEGHLFAAPQGAAAAATSGSLGTAAVSDRPQGGRGWVAECVSGPANAKRAKVAPEIDKRVDRPPPSPRHLTLPRDRDNQDQVDGTHLHPARAAAGSAGCGASCVGCARCRTVTDRWRKVERERLWVRRRRLEPRRPADGRGGRGGDCRGAGVADAGPVQRVISRRRRDAATKTPRPLLAAQAPGRRGPAGVGNRGGNRFAAVGKCGQSAVKIRSRQSARYGRRG